MTETAACSLSGRPGEIPAPEVVPWPRFSRSSSASSQQSFEIVLGPRTRLPSRLGTADQDKLKLHRADIVSKANISSSANCIRYSDYRRLTDPCRFGGPELSFGSALHVGDGKNAMCLVCSVLAAKRKHTSLELELSMNPCNSTSRKLKEYPDDTFPAASHQVFTSHRYEYARTVPFAISVTCMMEDATGGAELGVKLGSSKW